jgi:hypothetical protein
MLLNFLNTKSLAAMWFRMRIRCCGSGLKWCSGSFFMLQLCRVVFAALVADPPVRIRIQINQFKIAFQFKLSGMDPVLRIRPQLCFFLTAYCENPER